MYLRRRTVAKYGMLFIAVALFYCEWGVYHIQRCFWPTLKCEGTECTKILFIADPQIQGDNAVPSPLNHIFSFDSDQYLESTFQVAILHFRPDVLVYLGDLMDEGSVATMKQFHNYVKRLSDIFDLNYTTVNVWLPGDNDIGGELSEPVSKQKVEEFEKTFHQPSVITYRNISFYKVNAITNTYPKLEDNSTNVYKVVVSHYPVTMKYGLRTQVNNEIHPNIYFCAHTHDSKYAILSNKAEHYRKLYPFTAQDGILEITGNETAMYEIYVPTCSYRMGTDKMGYGAAVFDHSNQSLRYTVFWSPKRFPYLFFYGAVALIAVLYILLCIFYCAISYGYRLKQGTSKTQVTKIESRPLLMEM